MMLVAVDAAGRFFTRKGKAAPDGWTRDLAGVRPYPTERRLREALRVRGETRPVTLREIRFQLVEERP